MTKKKIEKIIKRVIEKKYREIFEADDFELKNMPHDVIKSAQLMLGRVFNYQEHQIAFEYAKELVKGVIRNGDGIRIYR